MDVHLVDLRQELHTRLRSMTALNDWMREHRADLTATQRRWIANEVELDITAGRFPPYQEGSDDGLEPFEPHGI